MNEKVAKVRSVAFVGHSDAGKTTLADRLLEMTDAPNRGSGSVFDFEPDEREKAHSLDAASGYTTWKGHDLWLVDAPGSPDLIGEAISSINAVSMTFVCVNAHAGIMVNTRRAWELATAYGRPHGVIITKCDLEPDKLADVYEQVREVFGEHCLPINPPKGLGLSVYKEELTELEVEEDDKLMEKYLEGEEVSEEELKQAGHHGVAETHLFPVFFTSATTGEGLETLLDGIVEYCPAPGEGHRYFLSEEGEQGEEIHPDPEEPFLGFVWRLQVDRHVGKIGHIRVLRGKLEAGSTFTNLRTGTREKISQIQRAQGKELHAVPVAGPGDLAVITKVESLRVGDTLCTKDHLPVKLLPYPEPMYALAAVPKARGDEGKISEVLGKVADECPVFSVKREESTGELVIRGASQLHLDIWLKRLHDRFGLDIETHKPKVPYKECITGKGEARYRHKKQTGGRGQFAEVALEIEPGPEGSGLDFSWDIFGGAIPTNYKEAVLKGIQEKMVHGVVAGYPLTDVKVSIKDGKHHDVDSSDQAFKYAAGRAFAEAVSQAKPGLLEPVAHLTIQVPGSAMGDVSADLNTRRGRIQGMDQVGEAQIIKADLPLVEAMDYSRVLTALTAGEGTFSMEAGGYEQVPGQVKKQLMEAFKPSSDED